MPARAPFYSGSATHSAPAQQISRSVEQSDPKTLHENIPDTTENSYPQWSSDSTSKAWHGYPPGDDRVSVFEPEAVQPASTEHVARGEFREDLEDDPPELPIAGRVSVESGDGISGISVVASAQHLFSADRDGAFSRAERKHLTQTDNAGFYEFRRLRAGEYEIRTEPTARLPGAKIIVWAGTRSADIVLKEAGVLRVFGTVRDTAGNPLGEALVQPIGQGDPVVTDAIGHYALAISIGQQGESYSLDVSKSGYTDRRLGLREADVRGLDEVRIDAVLEPEADTATVSGIVTDIDGDPVSGAMVRVYSPVAKQPFQALTEHNGDFLLPPVAVGKDYQLRVHAGDVFRDYVEQPLNVPSQGLKLPVILESVGMVNLSGRMVDTLGNPIPWLGLWLRNGDSATALGMINGDQDGYFYVEDVREGELSVQTHITPYLAVNGIKVSAGLGDSVELTLDWGDLEIQGKVTDEWGDPVPLADISVSWSLQDGPLHSRSSRRTTSGNDGGFLFSGLGPGVHALSIQAHGFQGAWAEHDPLTEGQNVLVELMESRGLPSP